MILNTKIINQVPSDKVLYQGKTKSDQLFDQYILKEAKAFADTNQSNFMADLDAKLHTNEKFKMYDKFNDFDRNSTFLTNASFSIRNPDTSLLLADRYSDDNAHFSIAKNPIKLYSFFDDMAPVVDYRHTNDLYYGLRLQGKTPQDIALSNAIYGDTGDHNNLDPTTRGIRQLGGDPSVEAEVFVENFMSSQKILLVLLSIVAARIWDIQYIVTSHNISVTYNITLTCLTPEEPNVGSHVFDTSF